MNIIIKNAEELRKFDNNPRIMRAEEMKKLVESIKKFGFVDPLIIDEVGVIIGGNQRFEAGKTLGMKEFPCNQLNGLSLEEKKALNIALNKISAEWDEKLLSDLISDIKEKQPEMTSLMGFDDKEINQIMNERYEPQEDELPTTVYDDTKKNLYVKKGEIYALDNHRLMCGDSTIAEDVDKLINNKPIDLLLTDPPYGVSYSNKNEFLNSYDKGNRIQIDIESDNKTEEESYLLWKKSFEKAQDNMRAGASFYIFSADANLMMMMMMKSIVDSNLLLKQSLVWVKNNHVLGRRDYNAKHENILYGWKKGTHNFYKDFDVSVWECDKPLVNDLHPTMKPIELLIKAINNSSRENENILDLFGGSGSTLIACEQVNRVCFMMEIDPVYCQIIVDRWEKLTGKKALKVK